MKADRDFIKEKIENESITSPDSLDIERILNSDNKSTVKLRKSSKIKRIVSLVACFAILIVSVFSVNTILNDKEHKVAIQDGIQTFNNYDEIEDKIKDIQKQYEPYYFEIDGNVGFGIADTIKGTEAFSDITAQSSTEFSKTNIQVEGIDEADVVKTDGKYIYFIDSANEAVSIFSVDGENVEEISKIKTGKVENGYLREIYLNNNRLIIIRDSYNNKTITFVYDVTDKENPKKEYTHSQSGNYVSSRMVNNYLYLITNYSADDEAPIPKVNSKRIGYDSIYAFENATTSEYIVASAIDISALESDEIKTKAVLGGGSDIYCSKDNIYVVCNKQNISALIKNQYDEIIIDDSVIRNSRETSIAKISYDKLNLNVMSTVTFDGTINNQYSMNEKDGYFYVAVTAQKDDKDINYLYVFDEGLKQVSRLDGFARNEHIEAVRYIGDYAYVITFEQTDPLFIIDLKNPKEPKITGSVKIDGFSTSLLPIDEKTLLGVGNCTKVNEFDGIEVNGIKLALFDISNPTKPRILDEYEVVDGWSSAQYDIKGITMFDNNVVIPINENGAGGLLKVSINNGKFTEKKRYEDRHEFERAVRINNYLYGVSTFSCWVEPFKL